MNIIGMTKLLYGKKQIKQKMTNNRLVKQTAGKSCRNMLHAATVAVERVISQRDFICSYAEVSLSLWSRFDLHVFHIVVILG